MQIMIYSSLARKKSFKRRNKNELMGFHKDRTGLGGLSLYLS